ncbi:MAG: hypothetical protein M2R45_04075 [Verrucomicrobia subdivision 3 bacterium]|nr:hypothetical protein [Limisphaerales bacterium]MCS1417014.1 hypothetical protein [Limisphaerales bacterium]
MFQDALVELSAGECVSVTLGVKGRLIVGLGAGPRARRLIGLKEGVGCSHECRSRKYCELALIGRVSRVMWRSMLPWKAIRKEWWRL